MKSLSLRILACVWLAIPATEALAEGKHSGTGNKSGSRYSVGAPSSKDFGAGSCDNIRLETPPEIAKTQPISTSPSVPSPSKQEFDPQACQNIPTPDDGKGKPGLAAIGWCVARTLRGGEKKLEPAIVVEYASISFMDPNKVRIEGCRRSINPTELGESDIQCGPTRPPEAAID